METIITTSTCIYLTKSGKYFMQVITAENQNHYYVEIPADMAFRMSKYDDIQIISEEINDSEPDNIFETTVQATRQFKYGIHIRVEKYMEVQNVIRKLGFRESKIIDRPNNKVYFEVPVNNLAEANLIEQAIQRVF